MRENGKELNGVIENGKTWKGRENGRELEGEREDGRNWKRRERVGSDWKK